MFAKIGFRIKQARINAQITQDTLAELIGCSTSFISRLECGKVNKFRNTSKYFSSLKYWIRRVIMRFFKSSRVLVSNSNVLSNSTNC
ncbi:MAG: helix-turn-helix domain-containing protein [Blautia wexlerae]